MTFSALRSTAGEARKRTFFLLESDVNELAQAKGANVAGPAYCLSNYGVDFDDIEVFYLAGRIRTPPQHRSFKRIGLFFVPQSASSKIVQAGNTAIEGATIALLLEVEGRGTGRTW